MKKIMELFNTPNIEGFLKPFHKYNQSSNVSPNNKIVKAYFYGSPHPGFPEHNKVSVNNRLVDAYLFGEDIIAPKGSSNVSPNNRLVNSKLKSTRGL